MFGDCLLGAVAGAYLGTLPPGERRSLLLGLCKDVLTDLGIDVHKDFR